MNPALLAPLALLALAALWDWRRGLFAMVLMAFLQDVARKLTPGQPIYFVVLVGVVFAATCVSALMGRVQLTPNRVLGWRRYLATPFMFLAAVLAVQAVRGYAATGSIVAVAIGLLTYVGPIPAVVFGYQYAARQGGDGIWKLFAFYAACVLIAAVTVYMEYAGIQSAVFGEVGEGVRIYDRFVGILASNSGIFRSSEVAAWHIAAAGCLLLIFVTGRRASLSTMILILAALAWLLFVGTVTGRRKLYVELAVFVAAYMTFMLYFGRRATKLAGVAAVVGLAVYAFVAFVLPADPVSAIRGTSQYQAYIFRSGTAAGDISDRVEQLGLGPIFDAYQWFGPLGLGLGTGSQGAGNFGGGVSGVAEGGLGKIMMELGLPGMFAAAWFGARLLWLVWQVLRSTARMSPAMARLTFGLAAFLVANASAFVVATQVFADLFVLLMIGTSLGFLLAMPVVAQREQRSQAAAPVSRRSVRVRQPAAPVGVR